MHPAIAAHRLLLEKWRHAMDLVGPGSLDPHFADAEAAVGWLTARGAWADLGSGAGFPGVALAALHPEARVTLVERRQKRAAFLEQVAIHLPNARVVCGDTADLAAGVWDGIVSRAYKPPADVIDEARRLLRPGGLLVLLVAKDDPPATRGFEPFHVQRYEIDGRSRRAIALSRVLD